jgi:two-component system response regulator FixJ
LTAEAPVIVIDDNDGVRSALRALLESVDLPARDYPSAEAYLADLPAGSCLIVDVNMAGMSGLELQHELNLRNVRIPLIVMTGQADVALAVRAMKGGALDFLEKPVDGKLLLESVRRAVAETRHTGTASAQAAAALALLSRLTEREKEVLDRLILGESNKLVANNLNISPRTVAIHRAHLQEKLHARGLSDLVRTVRVAGLLV